MEYAQTPRVDWHWQAMDGALVKAPLGEKKTGPNPTDWGTSGTKRSVLTDGNGIPLALVVAPANRHDMKLLEATLGAQVLVPPAPSDGDSRQWCLNRGYDYDEVLQRERLFCG